MKAEPVIPPGRIEGPTPNGGAYALVYRLGDRVEIVEFDRDDRAIHRTHMESKDKQ